ncbi:MAG TPA: discoidin domain-containing protein [Pyrinomonadaceae bacterium]
MKYPPRSNLSHNPFNFSLVLMFVLVFGIAHAWRTTGAAGSIGSGMRAQTVEETVTLPASDVKTWQHGYQWYPALPYCGPPFHIFPSLEEEPGSIFAGFEHYYDKGKPVFGCPDGAQVVFRGTAWFDLASISSKAAPLHVFATSALLHFKKDKSCPEEEILIANADWLKGFSGGDLVPGDPFKKLPASASEDTVMDVTSVVNNWLRGEDHGGYANYGFVFKGPLEADLKYSNNDACVVRYSDLSLTVKYKYDKAPAPIIVRRPDNPIIQVAPGLLDTRRNVALASNGAKASASSTFTAYPFSPGAAIDGEHKGLDWLKGGGWNGAGPTNNDWLQVTFKKAPVIYEIDVYSVQDDFASPIEPDLTTTFTKYGLTDFEVQILNPSHGWEDVPGGNVIGNDKVWRQFTFPGGIAAGDIRVLVHKTPDGYSRITELEAWTK